MRPASSDKREIPLSVLQRGITFSYFPALRDKMPRAEGGRFFAWDKSDVDRHLGKEKKSLVREVTSLFLSLTGLHITYLYSFRITLPWYVIYVGEL